MIEMEPVMITGGLGKIPMESEGHCPKGNSLASICLSISAMINSVVAETTLVSAMDLGLEQ